MLVLPQALIRYAVQANGERVLPTKKVKLELGAPGGDDDTGKGNKRQKKEGAAGQSKLAGGSIELGRRREAFWSVHSPFLLFIWPQGRGQGEDRERDNT